MIKMNNVSLSYGNFLALDDVSITVKDGSISVRAQENRFTQAAKATKGSI